jgi:hypothetical protein
VEDKEMKKLIIGLLLIVSLVALLGSGGCIRRNLSEAAGPLETRTFEYTGFTGVDVGSAMDLDITYADTFSVKITAGKQLFDHIRVVKDGDVLKVYTEGWSISWWWGQTTPRVSVTMPKLASLYLSGASEGDVNGFKSTTDFSLHVSGASGADLDMETGRFTAEVSGASNVKGRLTADGSDIEVSGASDFDLTGKGGNTKLKCSGASTASLRYFEVEDADVVCSGASNGSLNISGRLDAELSGASDFNYYGSPTLGDIEVSGASDLNNKTH